MIRTAPASWASTGGGPRSIFGVLGEVDMITSTLGKALGGAAGGFVAASAAVCDYLTQRARPQLFSNALPPTVAAVRSPASSTWSSIRSSSLPYGKTLVTSATSSSDWASSRFRARRRSFR